MGFVSPGRFDKLGRAAGGGSSVFDNFWLVWLYECGGMTGIVGLPALIDIWATPVAMFDN